MAKVITAKRKLFVNSQQHMDGNNWTSAERFTSYIDLVCAESDECVLLSVLAAEKLWPLNLHVSWKPLMAIVLSLVFSLRSLKHEKWQLEDNWNTDSRQGDVVVRWLYERYLTVLLESHEVEQLWPWPAPNFSLSRMWLALASPSCLYFCVPAGNNSPKKWLDFIKPQSKFLQKPD